VRAVQTAELVAAGLAATVSVDVVPALAPGESARNVVAAVQALAADACVLLVGHEPGISGLGGLLAGAVDFEALDKAEAARITDGRLRWRFAWNAEAPTPAR
jgi:phosphohistidine phosphatase SixA